MTTSDARAEYAAVRNGVGVIDRRDAGVIDVTGRDRASFLHALLSNEVKALAPGPGCAATLLDVHGKVQVLLLVWVLEDRILLVTPPGLAATTLEALDKYLFSEKVVLEEATEQWALFLAAGPEAPALRQRRNAAPPVAQRRTGAPPEARAWSSAAAKLDGIDVRLVRGGGETGEAEVWVAAPRSEADRVLKTLTAAGAVPVGATALESLRIETGGLSFPAHLRAH